MGFFTLLDCIIAKSNFKTNLGLKINFFRKGNMMGETPFAPNLNKLAIPNYSEIQKKNFHNEAENFVRYRKQSPLAVKKNIACVPSNNF